MIAPGALSRHTVVMNTIWTAGLTIGPSALVLLVLWLMEKIL